MGAAVFCVNVDISDVKFNFELRKRGRARNKRVPAFSDLGIEFRQICFELMACVWTGGIACKAACKDYMDREEELQRKIRKMPLGKFSFSSRFPFFERELVLMESILSASSSHLECSDSILFVYPFCTAPCEVVPCRSLFKNSINNFIRHQIFSIHCRRLRRMACILD